MNNGRWLLVAAAVTGILPFTILLMKGSNNRLLGFAGKELGREVEGELEALLGKGVARWHEGDIASCCGSGRCGCLRSGHANWLCWSWR